MPRRPRRHSGVDDVPTQSFADIAFLLIIFFILASTMIKTMGFRTELPAGEKSESEPEKTTSVQLHDGEITFNDDRVTLDGLRKRLGDMNFAVRTGDDKIVLFEAAGTVLYQDYYAVMAAITEAGANLVIVQEGDDEEGGGT